MKTKYLITGGTGFIGSNIVEQLVKLKKKLLFLIMISEVIKRDYLTLKNILNL